MPEIAVRDELERGRLIRIKRAPGVSEVFYAITSTRKFPNPHVEGLVRRFTERIKA